MHPEGRNEIRRAGGGAVEQTPRRGRKMAAALSQLDDEIVRGMAIGAVFTDYAGNINCLDFHRKEDLLVTSSEDDSIRLYNITSATLLKTTYHRKHGADRVCFTHHPSSILCSSRYNLESAESLRYLSLYDNRCLRYFKGHKDRVVSLCMSPVNDSFMSGSLDHSVRIWDLRVNACQGILRLRGRPSVAYDQQGLVFAVAMEGGAIKLFDSRSYDKGPFDTFLVGGDTAEVSGIKFSNDGKSMLLTTTNNHIYVLDAYGGDKRCGFSLEPSPNITTEAAFTPDGQYVISVRELTRIINIFFTFNLRLAIDQPLEYQCCVSMREALILFSCPIKNHSGLSSFDMADLVMVPCMLGTSIQYTRLLVGTVILVLSLLWNGPLAEQCLQLHQLH